MKVKSSKKAKNLDKLIAAVKAREILWDREYRGHRNRFKLERYWNEVAVELGISSVICRKRWKNLKDQCRKEMKKDINDSDWPHFHKLQFIHHLFLTDDDDEDIDGNDNIPISDDATFAQINDDSRRQRLGFTMRKKLSVSKRRSLHMDADKLIELVKEREIIWNRQHKGHHHWHKLDNCWKEIAQVLGVSRDEARIKWKYIRDTARKEYRKPDSEWSFIPKLEFLINQFNEFNETADEDFSHDFPGDDSAYYFVDNDLKEDEFDEFDTKPVITETDFYDDDDDGNDANNEGNDANNVLEQITTNPVELALEVMSKEKEIVDSTKDEDVGFFNSLLPHVRKLNPAKKMMLRCKIQEMVYNTVYNESQKNS